MWSIAKSFPKRMGGRFDQWYYEWRVLHAGNFCLIHAGNRSSKSFRTVASWNNHKFIRRDACVSAFWLQMTHMHFLCTSEHAFASNMMWNVSMCARTKVEFKTTNVPHPNIYQHTATSKHEVLLGHQLARTYKFKFGFLFFSQLLGKSKANITVITVYRIYVKIASKPPKTNISHNPRILYTIRYNWFILFSWTAVLSSFVTKYLVGPWPFGKWPEQLAQEAVEKEFWGSRQGDSDFLE